MDQYAAIMMTSFVLTALSLGGVLWLRGVTVSLLVPLFLLVLGMFSALKIEKLKKSADVSTFAEIIAFSKGKPLEQLKTAPQPGTIFFEKVGVVTISTVVFLMICLFAIGIAYLLR